MAQAEADAVCGWPWENGQPHQVMTAVERASLALS